MFRNWMRLTNDAVLLGFETQHVIGLRLVKLSRGGPAAESEALRIGHGKNHRFSGSRDDPRSRWLSWEDNTPLSNTCAGEPTPLVEVLATETNTLAADHHYKLFK